MYLIIYKWYIIVHEGWKWKTPYIQVCRIIRQVFFYRWNEPKKRFNWKVKKLLNPHEKYSKLMQYRNCQVKAWPLVSEMLIGSAGLKKKTGGEEKTHVNCKIIKNQCEELGVNHQEPWAVRVSTVQYGTVRDRTPWSSLRFHCQQYPLLYRRGVCRKVVISNKARQ